jgi:hypothetical protein
MFIELGFIACGRNVSCHAVSLITVSFFVTLDAGRVSEAGVALMAVMVLKFVSVVVVS